MNYQVNLTPLAESDYKKLVIRAAIFLRFGMKDAEVVRTHRQVYYALSTGLVTEPERGLRLPRAVSYVHVLPAGNLFIHYKIRKDESAVWVTSIDEDVPELNNELKKGTLSKVFGTLGLTFDDFDIDFSEALHELEKGKLNKIWELLALTSDPPDIDLSNALPM